MNLKEKNIKCKYIFLIMNLISYLYMIVFHNVTFIYSIVYLSLISIYIFISGISINDKKEYKRNINIYMMLYILCLISILFLVGRPPIRISNSLYIPEPTPFKTIVSQLKYGSINEIIRNIIGNLCLFIPLSFLLILKDNRYKNILRQTVIILPSILMTETLQMITNVGVFDIDDIILNYLGVLLFVIIMNILNTDKVRKLFNTDFHLKSKPKKVLDVIIILILILIMFRNI